MGFFVHQLSEKMAIAPVKKEIKGQKNGGTRMVYPKEPRFYAAEDAPKKNPKRVAKAEKLRESITPGTVLILLAGRFRGKRVVFLKQLDSGLLLVTGPYKVNGVPLRRVSQAYVIATSTKVELKSFKLDAKFNDDYFKNPAKAASQKSEEDFFATATQKPVIAPERISDQKDVDAQLLKIVSGVPQMKQYLNAKFSLKNGQYPHEMK